MTLTVGGCLFADNHANEGGGTIFFVSDDRTGTTSIRDSSLDSNVSDGFQTPGLPGIFFLGARDPGTGEFVMVGKCFKGLTDELLRWQTDELLARETARRGIAVLVRPELVVEIALDGVQSSTRYPGGVALRFARVKRYRPDKAADAADVIDDLRALLPAVPSAENRSDDRGTAGAQEVDPG